MPIYNTQKRLTMIIHILILFNVSLFLGLAFIHFYWASGGQWAIEGAVPDIYMDSYLDEKKKIGTTIATIIVALGLIKFSIITASHYYIDLNDWIDQKWLNMATLILGSIFVLRAIGDFKLFGIFKKKSKSKFAINDSRYYIPLCLYLGFSSILIVMLT